MKRVLAVGLLLLSLASAALADGAGAAPPPRNPIQPLGATPIQMADGAGSAPPPEIVELVAA